jgi:hypothetical protein
VSDAVELEDTIDEVAIRRVLAAYADVASRRAWLELRELFRPDAVVTVDRRTGEPLPLVGPDAVGDFIGRAIERFAFFEFVVLNARVTLRVDGDVDRAAARVFICELRQDAATGRWTNAYGVYHDGFVRVDHRWWFEQRLYHSLARTAPADNELFPFPTELDSFPS